MESGKERISKELNNKLSFILGEFFKINRLLDRGMSLLSVRWKMLQSSEILHVMLAHAAPLIADRISSYQDAKNCETIYPATPIGDQEYTSPQDFFNSMLEEFYRIEDAICDVIDVASVERDYSTKQFLQNLLSTWLDYVVTMQNVCDVAQAFGGDSKSLQQFDNEISHCIVVKDISSPPLVLEDD